MAVDPYPVDPINPFDLKSENGYTWLKGNLHTHTSNSDGRISPQERVDGYAGQGYDFLCLSDHRIITPVDSVTSPSGLTLIQGVELHPENPFGGQNHHFLALNVEQDVDSGKMPPQHVIDAVREQEGSIWLAHPYWSSVNILRDTLPLHGLAGVEVFNTTCRCAGRGESSVHWDDWMAMTDRLYPALAVDDAHRHEDDPDRRDTYWGWTMARVKDTSPQSIVDALESGAAYSSTGPEIHDIRLRRVDDGGEKDRLVEATVRSSEAQCISAVCDAFGIEYREPGRSFETAVFNLRPNARWARFEIVAPDGLKAWSNPFDLTSVERA